MYLDGIPNSDILIMLGDFNFQVGKAKLGSDFWTGLLGKHSMGDRN